MRQKGLDGSSTAEMRDSALNAALKPLKRTDVTQLVVDRLRDLLEQGVLKPGSKLPPEPEMSKLLGISRPSLRQAYKALSILGILRAVPGDGTYISDSTSKILAMPLTFLMLMKRISLDEIFEFRMMLEAVLARLAATRASESEIQAMASRIENMAANLDDDQKDAYLVSEYEFHNYIARAAHNSLLLEIISIVGGLLWETRKALVNVVPDRRKDLEEHRAILVAISGHDPQAAADAMRGHLGSALELAKRKALIQGEGFGA
ncbi:MAG TPA: FadR/GntR family transcriptional regulator [Terriglobia bacterium]|nr:FadR/GntR family transcriptional regulator [Terriglobia bacterium]